MVYSYYDSFSKICHMEGQLVSEDGRVPCVEIWKTWCRFIAQPFLSVASQWTPCFDTDFTSETKLTKLPCFQYMKENFTTILALIYVRNYLNSWFVLSLQVRGDRAPDEGSELVQHAEDGSDPTGCVAGGAPPLIPNTSHHGKCWYRSYWLCGWWRSSSHPQYFTPW